MTVIEYFFRNIINENITFLRTVISQNIAILVPRFFLNNKQFEKVRKYSKIGERITSILIDFRLINILSTQALRRNVCALEHLATPAFEG